MRPMETPQTMQVRARLTKSQVRALNVRAAEKGLDRAGLITRALHTSPLTRDLFKGEETDK